MTDDHQTPPTSPPPYEPSSYTPAPAHQEGNGMAVASLVLGILSVLTAWIPILGLVAWILAPLGLIFGFLAINKPNGKGLAIGGLITSGLGLLICILWVTFLGAVINQAQQAGAFENMPTSSSADINTDGNTTTITTPESTTTVTTAPNGDTSTETTTTPPVGDDAGASSHSGDSPPSN